MRLKMLGIKKKSKAVFSSSKKPNLQGSSEVFATETTCGDRTHVTWSEHSKNNDALAHKFIKKQIAESNCLSTIPPHKNSFQYLQITNAERFQRRILLETGKSTELVNPNEKAALKAFSLN